MWRPYTSRSNGESGGREARLLYKFEEEEGGKGMQKEEEEQENPPGAQSSLPCDFHVPIL